MAVLKNFLIALDQAVNCLIKIDGEWGHPDEMLSARAWRVRASYPRLHVWVDRVFFFDDNHCQECYEIEMKKEQHPSIYRRAGGQW